MRITQRGYPQITQIAQIQSCALQFHMIEQPIRVRQVCIWPSRERLRNDKTPEKIL